MSKQLPYFKFYVNQWLNGDITLEEENVQGVFINICVYYWSKECFVTFEQLSKKFKANIDQINTLINSNIIKQKNNRICINFLDEQIVERNGQKSINKENGKKGGRPKKKQSEKTEIKPNGFLENSENEANENQNITNIEQNKAELEQSKTEKNKIVNNLAELRSAYDKLQKSKELICNFIKEKNPEFIEPYSDLWNLFAEKYKMAKVEKLSDGRKKKLKTRLTEKSFNFIEIIRKLNNANDFTLTQQWLTFDWVIEKEKNYIKILEGNFDKKENSAQHQEPVKDFDNITAWQNCKLYEYSELTENIQSIYSEDFWIKWQKFNAYIDKSCPNIRKIDKQVEILEYKQLKEEFIDTGKLTTETFLQTLNNFDNHKQASEKYISVYKAIKSWLTK